MKQTRSSGLPKLIRKKTDELNEQTETRPKKALDLELNEPRKTSSFILIQYGLGIRRRNLADEGNSFRSLKMF